MAPSAPTAFVLPCAVKFHYDYYVVGAWMH